MVHYLYDGSAEGLLSAVFEYYERRPGQPLRLVSREHYQPVAFETVLEVASDPYKADRVWKGLQRKLPEAWQQRFRNTWLSELPESGQWLFDFACYIFDHPPGAEDNYGHPLVLALARTDRKVHREKHRMEAFVRFRKMADGLFFATISPDYNVLPLIAPHFRSRYADQPWIICDRSREYGLYYDLQQVQPVVFTVMPEAAAKAEEEGEALYQQLWKDYFRSTNIVSRENKKLHLQHVPRRYWKYLTEKQH